VCQGNTRLLILLEWCIRHGTILPPSLSTSQSIICFCIVAGDFGGHGNSFHGEGGRGNRMAQLRYVLRLILNMCTSSNDIIRQDFTDQGTISLLIGTLVLISVVLVLRN